MATATDSVKVEHVHLVVLNHGLWGSAANLRYLCRSLIQQHPGAYLSPRSHASTRILTDRERKQRAKQDKAKAKASSKDSSAAAPADPDAWEDALLEAHAQPYTDTTQPRLVLLNTRSNVDRTYDGIDFCSERIRAEIDAEVVRLRAQSSPYIHISHVSIIGYSLGGLVSRYLAGLLHSRHFFSLVPEAHIPAGIDDQTARILRTPPIPVQFVTLATPHLGMLPPTTSFRRFAAFIGARSLSRTGEQLFLRDSGWEAVEDAPEGSETRTSRGLIEAMSVPGSLFMAALNRFQKVVIYANAVNDPTVPFRTAALWDEDPFLLEGLHVETASGYPGLIQSTSVSGELPPPLSWTSRLRRFELPPFWNPRKLPLRFPLNYLIIPLFPFVFPLFVVLFLTRFHTESGDSRRRIRELRRLWREERALEAGEAPGDASAELAQEVGGRMSAKAGALGSAATSGTATPINAALSSRTPNSEANGTPAATDSKAPTRSWLRLSSSSGSRARDAQSKEEEEQGERSRIQALLLRVEEASQVGDGTIEGNRRRGPAADETVASSSGTATAASFRTDIGRIPPTRKRALTTSKTQALFPLQHDFIAHFEAALGEKLERRLAYFPKVLNAHPVIIVRMPGTELCRLGEGVVRHFVDSFVAA